MYVVLAAMLNYLLSGLSFSIHRVGTGITLRVNGFNDKMSVLVETILEAVQETFGKPFKDHVFTTVYQRELDVLKNAATKVRTLYANCLICCHETYVFSF